MSIYAISDRHGNLPPIPEDATVVIDCGDICPDYRPPRNNHWDVVDKGGEKQARWLKAEFRSYLTEFAARGGTYIATWGNHDFVGERPELVPAALPWTLLIDTTVEVDGRVIFGTPWVPGLPYWAFYGSDAFLAENRSFIPSGLDILVSHGPPWASGDYVPTSEKQYRKYGNGSGRNVGDTHLQAAILRAKPKLTLCGHIHEDRGEHRDVEDNIILNVSCVDGSYVLQNEPFVCLDPYL